MALPVPGQDSDASNAALERSSALPPDQKGLETGSKTSLQPGGLEVERALLWQEVYNDVQRENAVLISEYEVILSSASNGPIPDETTVSLPDKLEVMQHVVKFQRQRMLNKQWTWSLFGSNTKIRDTADAIMRLVLDSSALISVGMTLSPPYVSLPWSAICALIPVSQVFHFLSRL